MYDVIPFTVAVGGNYTFVMDDSPLFDGIAGIYSGSFDPNDPCTNLVGGDDDLPGIFESEPSFTVNLTPGTYYLVSSTWGAGQMGAYSWTFTGPAALQTPCVYRCYDVSALLSGAISVPAPLIEECSPYTVQKNIQLVGDECADQILEITYLVTDAFGYSATCVQEIAIENLEISDIVLPPGLVEMNYCGSGVTPGDVVAYFDVDSRGGAGIGAFQDDWTEADGSPAGVEELNEGNAYGYPHYYAVGRDGKLHAQKIDNNVCTIYASYTDQVIAACGAGCPGNSKVIRTWTLLDWCKVETKTYTQLIKAVDTKAPTFIVKDVTVSVNPWGCVANFAAPMPWELQDNCDATPEWWLKALQG
ncbi:MAG: hypothetical protein IPN29_08925 [Saprospiraceae bacterium]|nr:hypothetical protein [Saprospiraceae bacterium]